MPILTTKDLHWFRLANSAPSEDFYQFKDRFLHRFAAVEGFDLQRIERHCHTCEGGGEYLKGVPCNRCNGTGIYDIREHWLQRWNLAGGIYHKPWQHADVYHLFGYKYPEPISIIEGHIKHEFVTFATGRRAYYRLLLRHEPMHFYNVITRRIQARLLACRTKLAWRLIRLRNKLDLFKSVPEDDIPF